MANKQLIIDAKYSNEFKVLGLIQCISHEIEANQARLLKPFGISSTQLSIVHTLDLHSADYMTVNEIKDQMVDDSPNVSRSLKQLEDKQFIEKTRDIDDKRQVLISINKEGLALLKEIDKNLSDQKKMERLSVQELESLHRILDKIGGKNG